MHKLIISAATTAIFAWPMAASGADLSLASSNIGNSLELLRKQVDRFEEETGHVVTLVPMPDSSTDQLAQYKVWLSAHSSDVDLLMTDIVWAPQLSEHLSDLSGLLEGRHSEFLPSLVESQTVDGKLVALPLFTSAPALFYRRDLLEKHGVPIPSTWQDLQNAAETVMEAERADGKSDFWGYVFQGSPYEGLTCNALEWVGSSGGGSIIGPDGSLHVDVARAEQALSQAASWVGTISPPGVLSYTEEESRGIWQLGNAAFMRNWPYAETLGNFDDSAVKGKFGIAPLPYTSPGESSPTLGGWNVAVSKYSKSQDAAQELAEFLILPENQLDRLDFSGDLPTLVAIYEDPALAATYPALQAWLPIVQSAVARPAGIARSDYNEVSAAIWTAAHAALSGQITPAAAVEQLSTELDDIAN